MRDIAGVCLLDNPFHIDGVYDYKIPQWLAEDVREGSFVTVPFGVANHRRMALVVERKESSAYAEMKSVIAVCPSELSLNEEMLGLCSFMKLRTLCTTVIVFCFRPLSCSSTNHAFASEVFTLRICF